MKKFVLLFAFMCSMLTFNAKANWMGMIQELYDAYSDVNYANQSGQVTSQLPNVYRMSVAFADPVVNILTDWHFSEERRIALVNTDYNETYYPETSAPAGMCVLLTFNPAIGTPGHYNIVFPANIANPQGSPDSLNPEYTIKNAFVIAGDVPENPNVGVEETVAEAEVIAPVYDLMGRTVLDNATKADINNLPAGMYIFNGVKYIVK